MNPFFFCSCWNGSKLTSITANKQASTSPSNAWRWRLIITRGKQKEIHSFQVVCYWKTYLLGSRNLLRWEIDRLFFLILCIAGREDSERPDNEASQNTEANDVEKDGAERLHQRRKLQAMDSSTAQKLLDPQNFKIEGGLKVYHTYKFCTPQEQEDKLSVWQFEVGCSSTGCLFQFNPTFCWAILCCIWDLFDIGLCIVVTPIPAWLAYLM